MSSRRMTVLLLALALLLLLGPWVGGMRGGRLIAVLAGAAIPVAGVSAVIDRRRVPVVAVALGAAAAAASLWSLFTASVAVALGAAGLSFAFYVFVAWILGRRVFGSGRVSADTLAGAGCVYLLLGWIWWFAYVGLELARPGSFSGVASLDAGGRIDLLYFSFVTLTTLGYGDITPSSPRGMSLASLEAVTGVLFLAILIARLVGVYRAPEEP